jgi:hypothetical protein
MVTTPKILVSNFLASDNLNMSLTLHTNTFETCNTNLYCEGQELSYEREPLSYHLTMFADSFWKQQDEGNRFWGCPSINGIQDCLTTDLQKLDSKSNFNELKILESI